MKFLDFLIDRLNETTLIEMAYERKTAINKVRGVQSQIASHLIKLYAFDDIAKEHWISEIDTWMQIADDIGIKPNNKKLSGDMYYQLLWDEPLNNGVAFITRVINKLKKGQYASCKRSTLSDAQIYEQIEKLLHTISYDMANNKFMTFRDYI